MYQYEVIRGRNTDQICEKNAAKINMPMFMNPS